MKKFSIFALLLVALSACTSNEEEKQILIGKWSYDVQAILDSVATMEINDQQRAMVEGAMAIYEDAVFDLREDGQLIVVTNGIEQRGTWDLSKDGKQIYLNLSGQSEPSELIELKPNRFLLAPKPETGMFYKRIFIRVD